MDKEAQTGPLATMFGTYYPKGYIVAVFEDEARAEQAAEALRQAGFGTDDVRVHSGPEVVERHERFTKGRNLLQRLGSAIPSDEHLAMDEYVEHARQGRAFLTVYAPHDEQIARAHPVLDGYRPHAVRHYGEFTMTDLRDRPPAS